MKHQHTISREVEIDGRGLFTGEPVAMRMRPGEPHSGIWFIRTDQSPPIRIAAHVDNVSKRSRRTALRNGTVAIETVEHCLSACAGLGLDIVRDLVQTYGGSIAASRSPLGSDPVEKLMTMASDALAKRMSDSVTAPLPACS
ncbi:MAG: UDP-3-O-acyl-N-acetylglucosamine deacetylase, partial [Planctomycetes bacterium]|nr:UDP-3-O-acyl-N-acetylglucosamine deacetylase [Planctomycetota bacterium]